MNEPKEENQSSDINKLTQIHSSLLKLYSYLKMDKLQIVSILKNKIFYLLFNYYSYAKTSLFQIQLKTLQTFF